MILHAAALIQKHKGNGVFVDANVLVLFLVGLVNLKRIGNFKRTQSFSPGDFELIRSLILHFGPRLVATPHVLSQVSDLTDLQGPAGIAAARSKGVLILTADFQLHHASENYGVDALNFNHARQLAWRLKL